MWKPPFTFAVRGVYNSYGVPLRTWGKISSYKSTRHRTESKWQPYIGWKVLSNVQFIGWSGNCATQPMAHRELIHFFVPKGRVMRGKLFSKSLQLCRHWRLILEAQRPRFSTLFEYSLLQLWRSSLKFCTLCTSIESTACSVVEMRASCIAISVSWTSTKLGLSTTSSSMFSWRKQLILKEKR